MIIVIDDNKGLADITCRLLKAFGYDSISTYSGKEGIEKAEELSPKAILCDIGMEGMNGYDVARYITEDDDLKNIYMIAISGYSNEKDLIRSKEAGFNTHLSKPVDMEKLKAILDEI